MMTTARLLFRACLAPLALWASTLGAQELVTDRPDFTESAIVVPEGSVQIEGGVTWVEEEPGFEVLSGPEVLIRWGVSERFELRFGVPDHIEVRGGRSGLGDGSLGVKWQLGPTATAWDVGLIATLSLPTGDPGFTTDEADPELIFTLGRELAHGWSLGTQLAVASESAGARDVTLIAATAVLGHGLSSRAALFLELVAADTEDAPSSLLVHHGYTLLVRSDLQFDIHLGAGLDRGAPDALVGFGLSYRN